MTRILTFGVFDYFHLGHLKLFKRCREYGDYLIDGLQKDEYVAKFKPDQELFYTTKERSEMLEALRIVDEVFEYDTLCPDTMEKIRFDILALGEHHTGGRFDVIKEWCHEHGKSVIYLKRTPDISSSSIKRSFISDSVRSDADTVTAQNTGVTVSCSLIKESFSNPIRKQVEISE
ncbi:MAG: adenylyltransferase/cytidyltransferase family protein [Lachnospiraceae bacterium]|nr:adenylyltransferase/cytidyltransferase family protein [Lachnospiraceae bacterium]